MTRLLVCAPLRIEARAVRRGCGAVVVCTGMGPVRSARSVARLSDAPPGPVAVAGVCGALDPCMRPGDLVVATELRYGTSTIGCPSAEPLAAELRRTGLTVHTGPIVTVDRPAVGAGRAALFGTGARAVDMESAVLAGLAPGGPLAVVRAVADTQDRALFGLTGGLAALAALRRIGPALATWAAACGPREVLLASPRAFCAGVERAIEIVERALELHGPPVYVRKQIVHNRHVVDELQRRGAVFVDELDEAPPGARMVFSAHGVAPAVRAEATRRGIEVIDATWRRFAARSDLVLVVGSANSSNSHRLVEVAEQEGAAALLVDDPAGIDLRLLARAGVVGLTAGASAPPALVDAVVGVLGGLGPVEVTEHVETVETVHFTLPKGVRP